MTRDEQKNYQIAAVISAIFHLALILVYIPQQLLAKPVEIDTFKVGIMEMPAGSMDHSPIERTTIAQPNEVKAPVQNPPPKIATTHKKPVTQIRQPVEQSKPVAVHPNANIPGPSQSAKPEKPSATPALSGLNSGAGENPAGSSTPAPFQPTGLGTGQEMIMSRGQSPTYPKNVMNEGKEGRVVIRIFIAANGDFEQSAVRQSSGDPRMDASARSCFERNWKFKSFGQRYLIDVLIEYSIKNGTPIITFQRAETRP